MPDGAAVLLTLSSEAGVVDTVFFAAAPSEVQPSSASMSAIDCSILSRVNSSIATVSVIASVLLSDGAAMLDTMSGAGTSVWMSDADTGSTGAEGVGELR